MFGFPFLPVWAVHIGSGVLSPLWIMGGFVLAALLALIGAWRIRDEEIPQTALLTAAFFVASLIHIPGTNVHLLLVGLLGVVLGRRAALAIPVGLALQAVLFQHGGYDALGVNSCVMTLPALVAWQLFTALQGLPWLRERWFRGALVALSAAAWVISLIYGLALLFNDRSAALAPTWHVVAGGAAVVISSVAVWAERRLESAPEFPLGLLVGELSVLATVILHCAALNWGAGEEEAWYTLALISFVAHLPVAALEGAVLGFTMGFLARVKPELLGWVAVEEGQCSADPLH